MRDHGLRPRPALIGMSRGALYCMAWAAAHLDRTLLVYLDNGVCDFRSWPGGKPKGLGTGQGSPEEWPKLLGAYGFKDDAEALAYRLNPVDNLAPLAGAKVPLLLVYGDSDPVVPALGELGGRVRSLQESGRSGRAGRQAGPGPPPAWAERPRPGRRFLREAAQGEHVEVTRRLPQ